MSQKLIHTDPKFFNHKLSIPVDGVITLGPEGQVEVSDEAAEILLTIPNWIQSKTKLTQAENKKTSPNNKKDKEQVEDVNLDIDLSKLEELELNELLEIANTAELKVPPPMRTNKKSLVTYLRNQLKKKLAE